MSSLQRYGNATLVVQRIVRLKRLTFCLLGTATPADLIQDTRVSPFNIGKRTELRDFTDEEAKPLATGLSNNLENLSRILYWTGGHPYLTQRLCRSAQESGAKTPAEIDKLCNDLFLTHSAKESDDNLAFVRNRLLKSEVDLSALLEIYKQMRSGKSVANDETNPLCAVLKLSGVAKVENGILKVRNPIYARVFDAKWIETHLPNAEKRRQKAAYLRSVSRTLAIASLILAMMAYLIMTVFQKIEAVNELATSASRLRTNIDNDTMESDYITDMNLAQREYEYGNISHTVDILEETNNNKYLGLEWGYWTRMCCLDLFTLKKHNGSIYSVAFSPDGKRIVSGSFDYKAIVWDAQTGHETVTLTGHTGAVNSVSFSPDGNRIVTGSDDSSVKVWESQTGQEILTLKGHTESVRSVAFSPNGRLIYIDSKDNSIKVWNAPYGYVRDTLKGHSDVVNSISFSSDGRRMVTGSSDKSAIVWDARRGLETVALVGHTDGVNSVSFSPDGKRILTGSRDSTARVWISDPEAGHIASKHF